MSIPHPRPFYYLENFETALEWLRERYDDLLNTEERQFMAAFAALPVESRALLVRMIMRKGDLFRTGKLEYGEIGCPRAAAAPLVALGWLDDQPLLGVTELFSLLRKAEIAEAFRLTARSRAASKPELMAALAATFVEGRSFEAWCPDAPEVVYRVRVLALCERLRLAFFGNFDQTWSEFVLADLGIFNYEKVPVPPQARAFQRREHLDDFHAIFRCREQFHREEPSEAILAAVPPPIADNPWLESRREKLMFRIGQRFEKEGNLDAALRLYTGCTHPGSRIRAVRVLERQDRWADAAALAAQAEASPENEVERQQLARIVPRIRRHLGEAAAPRRRPAAWLTFELSVPPPDDETPVELATQAHLTEPDAPVHYVENTLINSLFGLLCWDVVFLPLPGAFFHEFHSAPADLYTPDFHRRREREFAARFAQLATGEYRETIRRTFARKAGIQSAFVSWGLLTRGLLEVALECLPPEHLERCFQRILLDVKSNRAGFPDLIQFWPRERRYRMIEVKGPGDRLQDNQIRWLDYCASYGMPVSVCHVRWAASA
ncbi:MAG: VRR-NUC domain-containing protein [Gammaproteobacteria bacterium]